MNIKQVIISLVFALLIVTGGVTVCYADETYNHLEVAEVMSTDPCVRVKLENIYVSGVVKSVRFAVWSNTNGQDDITWYTAKLNNGVYSADVALKNHKSTGLYNVHCYVSYSDGTMKFVDLTTFNVGVPSAENMSVSAIDINKGSFAVNIEGVENRVGLDTIFIGVKYENNSSGLKWFTAKRVGTDKYQAIVDIGYNDYRSGTYYVEASLKDLDGKYYNIGKSKCSLYKSVSSITATDVNNNESDFKISVKNPAYPGGFNSIHVAVWSKEGGQDDLVWYNTSKNNTEYTCNIPISSHKTMGEYNVHVYARDKYNGMIFLGSTVFSVDNKATASVDVKYVDKVNGKMMLEVSGINAPAGISKVQIPVWCSNDQSDIIWYIAQPQGDGTYKVLVDIAQHKKHWGTYKMHVYITMRNGIKAFACLNTYNLTKSSSDKILSNEVTATDIICKELTNKTGYYSISMAAPTVEGGYSHIEYAIWSNTNGKDDILWFKALKNTSGNYSADVSMLLFNEYGKYNVSAYAVRSDGSRVLVKESSFTLKKPSVGSINISGENRSKGTFNVVLSDVQNTSSISRLKVGVKSSDKNATTVWYEAKKSTNGDYIATIDIKNHDYYAGQYNIASQIVDFRGTSLSSVSTKYDFNISYHSLVVLDREAKESSIGIFLNQISVPAGVKNVKFAVWSKDKGQDDLVWYSTSHVDGCYYNYISIRNHKTLGDYYVHVYYTALNGKLRFIGSTGFSINSKATANVSVSEVNGTKGTFKVTVSDVNALSGVETVQVPVWCSANQSDIKWYTAQKQSDGTYVAIVNVANHKYNFGNYKVHAYVTMGNGVRNFVDSTTADISPLNYLKVEKINEGKAIVTLMNPGNGWVHAVSFPTWSKTGGQDDIRWYNASYIGNGNWSATIETKNHRNYGTYYTHAYVEYNGYKTAVATSEYTLKGLDFSDLLSRYTTVSQNNANGTFNMSKALLSFNGVVLQPGQTMSFFDIAGPCGKYQGYLVAGTVQGTGYGGGICQASTTLYGGSLRAGMTIVERRSHSSKSVYVPVGQDAMVSYGSSDFKIRNDHNRPVKIVTYVIGKTLYCEFWGIQEDWYDDVEVNSWATGAKTAAAERVYYKNGVIVKRERLTNSYYPKS